MSALTDKPEKTSAPKDIPKEGAPIPKKRCCRRCGKDVPVNRRNLCYRCGVITNIEQREPNWIPSMEHPSWCGCALPEHQRTERSGGGRFN